MHDSLVPGSPSAEPRLPRRAVVRSLGAAAAGAVVLPLLQACGGSEVAEVGPGTPEPTVTRVPVTIPAPSTPVPPPQAASAGSPPAAASAGGAGAHVVEMTDELKFEPAQLSIKVGDTVTWKNVGVVPHSSTDDPAKATDPANAKLPAGAPPWDSGLLNGGESFDHQFTVPGDYTYFCIPHETAGMVAAITVTP